MPQEKRPGQCNPSKVNKLQISCLIKAVSILENKKNIVKFLNVEKKNLVQLNYLSDFTSVKLTIPKKNKQINKIHD